MQLLIAFLLAASLAEGFVIEWVSSDSCPAPYRRFSKNHSGCLPRNPKCNFQKIGLDGKDEIQAILDIHNSLRSKVAMGQETRAGGLPTASNMMQMVWDEELAAVAQRWVENCNYDHDCNECRQVENFRVGQNLAQASGTDQKLPFVDRIQSFYNEVADYNKNRLAVFRKDTKKTGHFTQVIWADTWRVGCGYARYKSGSTTYQFYACNYGPGGNMDGASVYKQNQPCSDCPVNTCCGSSCRTDEKTYPGLCKMLNPNEPPIYAKKDDTIYNCDFTLRSPDCALRYSGSGEWVIKKTLSGSMLSGLLRGGDQSTVMLKNPIRPKSKFCLYFQYRKGSALAGLADYSKLEIVLERPQGPAIIRELKHSDLRFTGFSFNLYQMDSLTVGFKFSVPRDLHDHVVDIMDVKAYEDRCP